MCLGYPLSCRSDLLPANLDRFWVEFSVAEPMDWEEAESDEGIEVCTQIDAICRSRTRRSWIYRRCIARVIVGLAAEPP
jgi:hypothetical protein